MQVAGFLSPANIPYFLLHGAHISFKAVKTHSRDKWAEYILWTVQNEAGMCSWAELKCSFYFLVELKFCGASHSKCNLCMKQGKTEMLTRYSVNFYLGGILQCKKEKKFKGL